MASGRTRTPSCASRPTSPSRSSSARPSRGEITVPGQAFRYELTAAAGDALFLDGTGPPTTGVAYTLEGPDGRQVGPNPYADGDLSAVAPATGTYTLVVASWSGGLGAYTIAVTQP